MNGYCTHPDTAGGFLSLADWIPRLSDLSLEVRWFRRGSRSDSTASAFPGVAITPAVAENQERRRVLLQVIGRFAAEGQISRTTLHAAEAFLEALPQTAQLPKVAPDSEGGVLMAWSVPGQPRTLITVADCTLHAVARAGTAQAAYFPDIPFDGTVAREVLDLIPAA
jgi:hypothetical protein